MVHTGPVFYDDEAVFMEYQRRRQRSDSPNDTLEKPVIMDLIGAFAGQRILDLGCGDAAFGCELLHLGAADYVGVEGSDKMAALAQHNLAAASGRVLTQTLEEWTAERAVFDLVVSRLCLHYVADLGPIFANVFQTLVRGGRFILSVEHPVITSCDRGKAAGTLRQDWVVDDYFSTGVRVINWMGGSVHIYHRTIEDYVRLLRDAGFGMEDLREAHPQREHFDDLNTYERRKRIPLFLILAARKSA